MAASSQVPWSFSQWLSDGHCPSHESSIEENPGKQRMNNVSEMVFSQIFLCKDNCQVHSQFQSSVYCFYKGPSLWKALFQKIDFHWEGKGRS